MTTTVTFKLTGNPKDAIERDNFFEHVAGLLEECAELWRDGRSWTPSHKIETGPIECSWDFTETV